jgi:phosphoribosylpyrophosphate synthetase
MSMVINTNTLASNTLKMPRKKQIRTSCIYAKVIVRIKNK